MTLTKSEESRCRQLAGVARCPVVVVTGNSPPRKKGEPGYTEFRNGGRCRAPGAAMKKGYRVRYVRSTLRVEVGQDWLALERVRPLLKRQFAAETSVGVVADWLDDRGEHGAATLLRES